MITHDFATPLTLDLMAKCRESVLFNKKTLAVYSVDDLIDKVAQVPKPAVGVMYEGARASNGGAGQQIGVNGDAIFSLLLLCETSIINPTANTRAPAQEALDSLRSSIQGTRAPNGHLWAWTLEAPAKNVKNLTVWVQRWTCPVKLPPRKPVG